MNIYSMHKETAIVAASRIMERCNILAKISESPNYLTRLYLSPEHLRANALVGQWMQEAGMKIWQDSVGNICGRYEGNKLGAKAILLGSHLDTVYNAGHYDGILGVLTAIEVVQYLHQQSERLSLAIEVIGFADEEGTRFGITLLGSRAICGTWSKNWIKYVDKDNITVAEAMKKIGLNPDKIGQAARNIDDFVCYIELHIEQGPCLYTEQLALGVVTNINGARRLNCQFVGEAGHAGTVPMNYRKDALAAAAEWIVFIEQYIFKYNLKVVATIGSLECYPGTANVIPSKVHLKLDIRGTEDTVLKNVLCVYLTEARKIATRRKVNFSSEEYYRIPVTICDTEIQKVLIHSIVMVQGRAISLPSGAGHDATAIADCWPVGMIFLRCNRGISHNPEESIDKHDVVLAVQAYVQSVINFSKIYISKF